ncbi:MAG: hypothetical protein J7L39_03510 [Candidatus Aenigmarchaeota archaeon]|nr:hypothetical protein [Candidatus Aenigmarchaeota archaeon]
MQTELVLPKNLIKEIDKIGAQFGFKNEREFVKEAVKEKILSLKKKLFMAATDKIKGGLRKKGVSEATLLKEFEEQRK